MLKTIISVAIVANILLTVSASISVLERVHSTYRSVIDVTPQKSADCNTPRCGKLEVPDPCINGGCFKERKCSEIIRPFICIDVNKCQQGCLCKEGYLRNKHGECIPKNQCPEKLKCPRQNEVYDSCIDKCRQDTCESIDKQYDCPLQSSNDKCTGGCVCEPGYFRNKLGDCITEENCRKCIGPNEYYSCGGACDNVCATLDIRNQTSCDRINVKCNEMCYCEEGYARDENGTCVPFDQCPSKAKCGKNEVSIKCPALYCKPRTCEQKGTKPFCPRISPGLPCPGPKEGCVCKSGYLRDSDGNCIPEDKCQLKCPRQNEVYDSCVDKCRQDTCESIDKQYNCPFQSADEPCTGRCVCEPGYFKNKIGECITEENCRKCMGPNEYYSCGGACDNVCATLHIRNQTICDIINVKCNEMCYCEEGYARDENGICVPFDQCPSKAKCGKNEVSIKCPALYCKPRTCEQKGKNPVCLQLSPGLTCPGPKEGCVCKSGYLRDTDGKCIPEDKCRPTCGINEEHSDCINGGCSGGKTCEEMGAPVKCVKLDPKNCIKGCNCIEGHVKSANGTCIPEDQCPRKPLKCGKFEVLDDCANGGCYDERRCSDIGSGYKCVRPIRCEQGCLCKPGYLRNSHGYCVLRKDCPNCCKCVEGYVKIANGTCIPEDQCPNKPLKCGKFEVLDDCANGGCYDERRCSDIGSGYKCLRPMRCEQGCLCKPGYLRNSHGYCVLRKNCPNYAESDDGSKENNNSEEDNTPDDENRPDECNDASEEDKNGDDEMHDQQNRSDECNDASEEDKNGEVDNEMHDQQNRSDECNDASEENKNGEVDNEMHDQQNRSDECNDASEENKNGEVNNEMHQQQEQKSSNK